MNNIFKRIIAMLLICFVTLSNCIAFADEIENTEEEVNTPPITDTSIERTYDAKKGVYKYVLSKETYFTSDVPNGIVTNGNVNIDISDKIKYKLTKDGEAFSYVRGEPIDEDGIYNLTVTTSTSLNFNFDYTSDRFSFDDALTSGTHAGDITEGDTATLGTDENTSTLGSTTALSSSNNDDFIIMEDETGIPDGSEFSFKFRILTDKCNDMNVFNLPVGYAFKKITYNDVEEDYVNKLKYYLIEKDGTYAFTIYDKSNPRVEFTTKVPVKRQIPALKLTGVTNSLSTYNPVTIEKLTDGVSYAVKLDGEDYTLYGDSFTDAGLYTITASDDYGNTNEYSFRILYTLNISSGTVIFLLIVIVVGLTAYMIYLHKHMRVN